MALHLVFVLRSVCSISPASDPRWWSRRRRRDSARSSTSTSCRSSATRSSRRNTNSFCWRDNENFIVIDIEVLLVHTEVCSERLSHFQRQHFCPSKNKFITRLNNVSNVSEQSSQIQNTILVISTTNSNRQYEDFCRDPGARTGDQTNHVKDAGMIFHGRRFLCHRACAEKCAHHPKNTRQLSRHQTKHISGTH